MWRQRGPEGAGGEASRRQLAFERDRVFEAQQRLEFRPQVSHGASRQGRMGESVQPAIWCTLQDGLSLRPAGGRVGAEEVLGGGGSRTWGERRWEDGFRVRCRATRESLSKPAGDGRRASATRTRRAQPSR